MGGMVLHHPAYFRIVGGNIDWIVSALIKPANFGLHIARSQPHGRASRSGLISSAGCMSMIVIGLHGHRICGHLARICGHLVMRGHFPWMGMRLASLWFLVT